MFPDAVLKLKLSKFLCPFKNATPKAFTQCYRWAAGLLVTYFTAIKYVVKACSFFKLLIIRGLRENYWAKLGFFVGLFGGVCVVVFCFCCNLIFTCFEEYYIWGWGLEPWLSCQEHSLLLQRLWVQFPAATWIFKPIYNSSLINSALSRH